MEDIVIIGAGVTGGVLSRELSKYNLDILLIEKENDVGNVTSSANSAIIHSGYDPLPGSLKAKMNVRGCALYPQLAKELDVDFYKTGTLTVVNDDSQLETFNKLLARAKENGVEVKALSREETLELEPNLNPDIKGSLFAKDAGIINPFELVIHAVENAVDNGVKLHLNEEVKSIKKIVGGYEIETNISTYQTKCVINCAGLYADKIASMIEDIDWEIKPKKGEYYILGSNIRGLITRPIFPLPSEKGKGILVSLTTAGNIYLGPSSEYTLSKDDYSTDPTTLAAVRNGASRLVNNIPMFASIRVFAGLRSESSRHDFIIEPSKKYNSFINIAGIESPGFASAPAISEYVIENFISNLFKLQKKDSFNPLVKKYIKMKRLSIDEQNEIISKHPEYGKIVCQCEEISLGEILDCLSRSVPPRSIKGVKRRTRAGFGLCQGGFCMNRVSDILANYYKIPLEKVNYDSDNSPVTVCKTK